MKQKPHKPALHPSVIEARIQAKRPYISIDYDSYTDTKTRCKFIDSEFGEWWTIPDNVLKGGGHNARHLSTLRRTNFDSLPAHVDIDTTTYTNMRTKCRFIDSEFGEWWAIPDNVVNKGKGHPLRSAAYPALEGRVAELIEINRYSAVPEIFNGKEYYYKPDFMLTDTVFLDVDGIWWHSSARKADKLYHFRKRERYAECGARIIQIRENEILHKPLVVKSMIQRVIGTCSTIQPQECEVSCRALGGFFDDNGLREDISARHMSLVHRGTVIAAIAYHPGRPNKIFRYCELHGHTVAGGLSFFLGLLHPARAMLDLRYEHLEAELQDVKLNKEYTDLKTTSKKPFSGKNYEIYGAGTAWVGE